MINQPLFLGTFSLFAIILTSSAALGLFISWWLDRERRTLIIDGGLGLLLIALIGARAGFVIRNLSYFADHPWQMPQFWLGGLVWPGALLAGGLALVGISLIWKEPLGELADSYLPLLGIVTASLWITSWWAGAGYGPETGAWFGIPVRDLFGVTASRWPFPILGALSSAGWAVGAVFFPIKRGSPSGYRALIGLSGLVVIRLVFSLLMADPAPVLWGLRRESWFSIGLVVLLAAGIYLLDRKEKNERAET